jgi:hypothetical protein
MIQPLSQRIPPLETGDRLSREEFERRYDAMPHLYAGATPGTEGGDNSSLRLDLAPARMVLKCGPPCSRCRTGDGR